MSRNDTITAMRSAGYHSDNRRWTRLLIEGRVRREVAEEAFREGARLRERGMGCTCYECKQAVAS